MSMDKKEINQKVSEMLFEIVKFVNSHHTIIDLTLKGIVRDENDKDYLLEGHFIGGK
jgi:hypothetical protein